MNQHRRPSSNPAQTSELYTHLKSAGHSFSLENVVVLDREEQWHRMGVKEAIWERVENPSLNKNGGRPQTRIVAHVGQGSEDD